MLKIIFRLLFTGTLCFSAVSAKPLHPLHKEINDLLTRYYTEYNDLEHFSGLELSVYLPNKSIKSYYVGKVSRDKKSREIGPDTLFQIGSITKSFVSAIILQLEKQGLLNLDDPLGHFFPEYSKWSDISLRSLLNMTSGIPEYTNSPILNYQEYKDMSRRRTDPELIQLVYAPGNLQPPLRSGYYYVNTGYILAGMIIEKVTKHSFKTEIENRLFKAAKLENTFYPVPVMSKKVTERLASGYQFNPYFNAKILGVDMKMYSPSSASSAGAVVSNSADIIQWVKALFVEDQILDTQQKAKLMQLISTQSAVPIHKTSAKDARGFGLGVSQRYDAKIGRYWSYEGKMPGYRAMYIYSPASGMILSAIVNSSVDDQNDHLGDFLKQIYLKLLE